MTRYYQIGIAFALMLAARPGFAQQVVGPGSSQQSVRVRDDEAPPGCRPYVPNTLMPGHCQRGYFLYRQDGVNSRVISWGTNVELAGEILDCNFCHQCCAPAPECNYCIATLSVSDSRSFQFQIAAGIRYGQSLVRQALEVFGQGIFGFVWQTSRTWSASAGSDCMPPCTRGRWRMKLLVKRGVVVATDSVSHWQLDFWGGPGCDVSYHAGACDEVRTSTLTSTWWAIAYVEGLPVPPCRGNAASEP